MSRDGASRLAHDVGKYISRIARNVPAAGPMPAPLVPLLVKDLYAMPGNQRASALFDELAPEHASLSPARRALAEIDRLEAQVRAGENAACLRACQLALEVEATIRSYAKADP